MHAPLRARVADSVARSAHTEREPFAAAHPAAALLNSGPHVRQLRARAIQLNERGPEPPGQAAVGPVVQGFWTEAAALGLGALGLGYWWWNRGGQNQREQPANARLRDRILRERAERERAEREPARARMVESLVNETEAVARHPDVKVMSTQGATVTKRGKVNKKPGYHVLLNRERPFAQSTMDLVPNDPHLARITRLHELTHVAVFKGYGRRNAENPSPENIVAPLGSEAAEQEEEDLDDEVQRLRGIARDDPVLAQLPANQRSFIIDERMGRMGAQQYEFDTIVNELLYYFHLSGISADSPLSMELVRVARERQRLRRRR